MAKIAVNHGLGERGSRPALSANQQSRVLAKGQGWQVEDVICRSGPQDHPFEEQHSHVVIALVLAGTFQYRVSSRRRGSGELMTPGSLLLGNAGQPFECGHEHGTGDHCLGFRYDPEYFEQISVDVGAKGTRGFPLARVPAIAEMSLLAAQSAASLVKDADADDEFLWHELSVRLAARVLEVASGPLAGSENIPPSCVARVTRAVRMIDADPVAHVSLEKLAARAGLSPYHFLRTFEQVTGITPHQYVRRMRLRKAAARLKSERTRVLDVAMGCGFGDVSAFNRAFHAEFGTNPRAFRRQA